MVSARVPRIGYSEWTNYLHGYDGTGAIDFRDDRPQRQIASYEYISSFDEPTFNSDSSRKVKPCYHLRWFTHGYTISGHGKEINSTYEWDFKNRGTYDPQLEILRILGLEKYRIYPDWDAAVQSVIPSFRNQFNLLNFALEFDDVIDLSRNVMRYLRTPLKTVQGLRKPLNSTSDAWLQYQFGIAPLLADMRAVVDAYRNFGEKLGKARAQLHLGTRFGVQKKISVSEVVPLTRSLVGFSTSDFEMVCYFNGTITHTTSGRVRGSIPESPLKEYLDYIGLYPDLSTVWNAIPFSFLVDYFIPIGRALERPSWISPKFSAYSCCVSIKFSGSFSVVLLRYKKSGQYNLDLKFPCTVATGTFSFYDRYPTWPVFDGLDLPRGISYPNARQAANLAALGVSSRR